MLSVFVPTGRLAAVVERGSALVGESGGHRVLCHYQKPSPSENVKTFADRAYHAADRLRSGYPTHQMLFADAAELIEVGVFDENTGHVHVSDSAALTGWLGAFDPAELAPSENTHFVRRAAWERAARSPNPALAAFARAQLAR